MQTRLTLTRPQQLMLFQRAFYVNPFQKQLETYDRNKFTAGDAHSIYNKVLPQVEDLSMKDLAKTINDLSLLVVPIS